MDAPVRTDQPTPAKIVRERARRFNIDCDPEGRLRSFTEDELRAGAVEQLIEKLALAGLASDRDGTLRPVESPLADEMSVEGNGSYEGRQLWELTQGQPAMRDA